MENHLDRNASRREFERVLSVSLTDEQFRNVLSEGIPLEALAMSVGWKTARKVKALHVLGQKLSVNGEERP